MVALHEDDSGYFSETEENLEPQGLDEELGRISINCPAEDMPILIQWLAGLAGISPGHYFFDVTTDGATGTTTIVALDRIGNPHQSDPAVQIAPPQENAKPLVA